jgi:hypothetical protein
VLREGFVLKLGGWEPLAASVGSKTPEADVSRPDLLGLVATRVERLLAKSVSNENNASALVC